MERLRGKNYIEPLRQRILEDKPFLGICVALQTLFHGSEESPGVPGLALIPGIVKRFDSSLAAVPQIGWNGIISRKPSHLLPSTGNDKFYFVHSYYGESIEDNNDWLLATSYYCSEFIAAVQKGNVSAVQFHPEKSGKPGLDILHNFLSDKKEVQQIRTETPLDKNPARQDQALPAKTKHESPGLVETDYLPGLSYKVRTTIAKRVIACLDVRTNEQGDLVVTKGDQYDVREKGQVRNLGKPVELAKRYYEEGADEITFLNITGFRDFPLNDQPMLEVLQKTSENVFVPLTIGGGIREFTDSEGRKYTALEVASSYFRAGADKVSIGSDAVYAALRYIHDGGQLGKNCISEIAEVYGAQAVVISVDPRRVYVQRPEDTAHHTIKTEQSGPQGEQYCWYQCTVKGGREGRDLDVIELVQACEKMGAGEILLNCIDRDGTSLGFDWELVCHVRQAVSIPVIASSGAGKAEHFVTIFKKSEAEAALAAGIFHRREVSIEEVKSTLHKAGIEVR
ncbi:unnamed protein product [Cyprideis torosa]|uniref:Glutamine amidotransferase domain-containing protein n=1 Tax=Cyprideis torosa TaxID=163714 RepID=A0A7R8WU37_9CRUS|nr:unnamed protein product [Cyprideis torosa]CAG0906429.1 unnamed protein product [Cyprideis torosa]